MGRGREETKMIRDLERWTGCGWLRLFPNIVVWSSPTRNSWSEKKDRRKEKKEKKGGSRSERGERWEVEGSLGKGGNKTGALLHQLYNSCDAFGEWDSRGMGVKVVRWRQWRLPNSCWLLDSYSFRLSGSLLPPSNSCAPSIIPNFECRWLTAKYEWKLHLYVTTESTPPTGCIVDHCFLFDSSLLLFQTKEASQF